MMFHFPYLGMPYSSRYSRYGYQYPNYAYKNYYNSSNNCNNKQYSNFNKTTNNYKSNHVNDKKTSQINKKATTNTSSCCGDDVHESPIFQIFGIDLFFDDILLICLIWFLYNEGVKDEELFIALILLLLS